MGIGCCFVLLVVSPAHAASEATGAVPGELIVTFEPQIGGVERARAHNAAQTTVKKRIVNLNTDLVKVKPGQEATVLRAYESRPDVRAVSRNFLRTASSDACTSSNCFVPSDPLFPRQWSLQNDSTTVQPPGTLGLHDADIDAPFAWRHQRGSRDTKIAILDSGVKANHEDLANKVILNADVTGFLPTDDTGFLPSPSTDDTFGHGTSVAGVAAAEAGNGKGVAGVGLNSSLFNIKVYNNGEDANCLNTARGIDYATTHGANVINISITGPDICPAEQLAVDQAWNSGVLLVAAAGNEGLSQFPTRLQYPAAFPNVIAVASTTNQDLKAFRSSYGSSWVDVAAPGAQIYTTLKDGGYGEASGTSFAAPQVAGAAGLLWPTTSDQNGNGRRNDDLRARLEQTAEAIPGTARPPLTGTDWYWGRLNLENAALPAISPGDQTADANCRAEWSIQVAKNPDRPTTLRMAFGDGSSETRTILQGSGSTTVSFVHEFPSGEYDSGGEWTQRATLLETGAFDESHTTHNSTTN